MSNIFVDGFALYGRTDLGTPGATVVSNMLAGVYATVEAFQGCEQLPWDPSDTDVYIVANGGGDTNAYRKILPATQDEIYFSCYYALGTLPGLNNLGWIISFRDNANTEMCRVVCESTGAISVYKTSSTVLAQTAGPVLVAEQAAHLEIKAKKSTGAVAVYVNGVVALNVSGLTFNTTASNVAAISINAGSTNPTGRAARYMSSVIVRDVNGSVNNTFPIGERKVATLLVNSDDLLHQGWTPQFRKRFGTAIGDFHTAADNSANINANSSTQTDLGVGDFTIEGSVRFATLPTGSNKAAIFGKWNETGNTRSYQLYVGGPSLETGNTVFRISTDGLAGTVTELISYPFVYETDRWYHIAISRASGETMLFVDGVQLGLPVADASTYFAGSASTALGGQNDSAGNFGGVANTAIDGWLDEVRLTVGFARYTTGFTPPTDKFPRGSGSDAHWANVALLVGWDSGTFDESGFGRSLNAHSAVAYTTEDGAGNYETMNKLTPFDDTFVEAPLIAATAILTQTSQPANTKTVTLGTKDGSTVAVYTWKTVLTTAFDVKIGATLNISLANLVKAINLSGVAGTDYGVGTTANFDVTAAQLPIEQIQATAITPGTAGNAIACSTNDTNGSWSGATLVGGLNIPSYSQFGFQRPPNHTTIIDSVTLVHRDFKTDAGTATVQASFVGVSGGVLAGTANNITTTPTVYEDLFEADPDGGSLTPTTIIGGKVRLNRTA